MNNNRLPGTYATDALADAFIVAMGWTKEIGWEYLGTDGFVRVWSGQVWVTVGDPTTPANEEAGDYVLALSDAGGVVILTGGIAQIVDIPLNAVVAFPIGSQVVVFAEGAGVKTIRANDAAQILNGVGGSCSCDFNSQWGAVYLLKRDTNTWIVYGDHDGVAAP